MTVSGKKAELNGLSAGRIVCRQFVLLIGKYLEGELSKSQHRSFERHRTECHKCSKYLAGYRGTVAAVRSVKDLVREEGAEIPEHLVASILKKIGL